VHARLSRRAVRAFDVTLVVWLALWLVFASLVHRDLRRLSELSDAAVAAGEALTTTADALSIVGSIPFVGDTIPDLEQQIRDAARESTRAGRQSRDDLATYAIAITLAVAVGPTLPPLLFWLPVRRRFGRDRRFVAAALAAGRADVHQYLARRALAHADYPTFALHTEADGELRPDAVERLAQRELRRLGLEGRAAGDR
jgi:uncharacterized membrane protein